MFSQCYCTVSCRTFGHSWDVSYSRAEFKYQRCSFRIALYVLFLVVCTVYCCTIVLSGIVFISFSDGGLRDEEVFCRSVLVSFVVPFLYFILAFSSFKPVP
jgi:hypothetical protein